MLRMVLCILQFSLIKIKKCKVHLWTITGWERRGNPKCRTSDCFFLSSYFVAGLRLFIYVYLSLFIALLVTNKWTCWNFKQKHNSPKMALENYDHGVLIKMQLKNTHSCWCCCCCWGICCWLIKALSLSLVLYYCWHL